MQPDAQRFGPVAIALHWTIAVLVIGAAIGAWIFQAMANGDSRNAIIEIHKSVGVLILTLTCLRLVWRLTHRAPPLPAEMSAWQRLAAWATHAGLYILTLALPVTGYLMVTARARETTFFGLFKIPQLIAPDRALGRVMEQFHVVGQYVLYALLAAHVGAALYHRFVLRDGVLARMWPFRAAERG